MKKIILILTLMFSISVFSKEFKEITRVVTTSTANENELNKTIIEKEKDGWGIRQIIPIATQGYTYYFVIVLVRKELKWQ